jgi:hypothetical protein
MSPRSEDTLSFYNTRGRAVEEKTPLLVFLLTEKPLAPPVDAAPTTHLPVAYVPSHAAPQVSIELVGIPLTGVFGHGMTRNHDSRPSSAFLATNLEALLSTGSTTQEAEKEMSYS